MAVAITLTGMLFTGRLNDPDIWNQLPLLIAATLAGCYLGHRAVVFIPATQLRNTIYGLLIVSGVSLALHGMQ